jgi:hypothetical protein
MWSRFAIAVASLQILAASGQGTSGDDTALADVRRRLTVAPCEAGDPGKPRYRADWMAACDDARRRNCPMLIIFSDDGSVGMKSVVASVHSKPAFATFSREVVLLIAYDGKSHPSTKRASDRGEVEWCGLFDLPCAEHRALYAKVHEKYVTREYWNPLHLFVDAEGKEVARAEGHEIDQARLDHELARARRRLGPGLSSGEYAELMKKLKGIVDGREKAGAAAAWRELGDLLAAQERADRDGSKGALRTAGMADYVRTLRDAIVEEGEIELRQAQALAAAGDVAKARARFERLERSFKELPPGKKAAAALKPKGDGS